MPQRFQALITWLTENDQLGHYQLHELAGDASFRRYYRLINANQSFIAMDAPPATENCRPFVAIAKALKAQGLNTPEIIAADVEQGFLLLSDFGDKLFLRELNETNAERLYGKALKSLQIIRNCNSVEVPHFTEAFMRQELELCKEWFLQKYLNLSLAACDEKVLNQSFDFLATSAAQQKQSFMHRDFHSANLMVLENNQIGILDFQDAFIGPVTYDLVSLLRDCYIAWPDALIKKMVMQYHAELDFSVSADEFLRWFDLMGMQRHLKALLTFARKNCRDNNSNYLQHIPRTLNYVLQIGAKYPETKELVKFLEKIKLCAQ